MGIGSTSPQDDELSVSLHRFFEQTASAQKAEPSIVIEKP